MTSTWGKPWTDHKYPTTKEVEYGLAREPKAITRPSGPIMTGSSVIAVKFKGGIMLAADTLASYGSMARDMDVRRVVPVGQRTLLGCSGDMSDFQFLKKQLDSIITNEEEEDDGHTLSSKQIYDYLALVLYNRRSEMKPLFNSYVIAGLDPASDKLFLGYVDLLGTTYTSDSIGTGFGAHFAQPLLRKALEGRGEENPLTEEEAAKLIRTCMKVLYYRDARSLNRYQIGVVTKDGVRVSEPETIETQWGFAFGLRGYGAQIA